MSRESSFTAVGALLLASLASPASAQYPPQPPPPPYGQPAYAQPAYSLQPPSWTNTARVSGGVAFVGIGYWCSYYGYCGYGYSTTQPNINLEVDLSLKGPSAVSFGANVFWGSHKSVDNTVWEPHVDYLFRSGDSLKPISWRFRIGAGMYIAQLSGTPSHGGSSFSRTEYGGAFRIGGGVSLLNDKVIGIGLDALFEGGSIRGHYVSTIQLLAGPEFHF